MNRLLHAELLKQRTAPVFVVGCAAAPAVAALVTFAVLSTAGHDGNDPLGPQTPAEVLGAPASVVTLVALLLGIVGMAGEYRHRTITTTLLAAPRRRDVVVAKVAAHAVTGAAMGAASLAVTAAVAVPWLARSGVPVSVGGDAARIAAGVLLSTALHAALGVAVGALVRNQTAAVAGVLVWLLAVEGLAGDVLGSPPVLDWLPGALAAALVHAGPGATDAGAAAAGLAAYVAGLSALATRLVVSRDVG